MVGDASLQSKLKAATAHAVSLQSKIDRAANGNNRAAYVNASDLKPEGGRKKGGAQSGGGAGKPSKLCGYCHETTHEQRNCYSDPGAPDETKQRVAAHKLRNPAWQPLPRWSASANMMSMKMFGPDAVSVASASAGNQTSVNILLDSASDQCILNHYHRHLFHGLKALNSPATLSGIGGETDLKITHLGTVTFMGSQIHNVYYSPNISKSVFSEGLLCSIFNFRIIKDGDVCSIINKVKNISTDLFIDTQRVGGVAHYLLPIDLFDHDPNIHSINLASVRPSNPKTLWHGRFGHAYLGLILQMARQPLYQDRGLKLPSQFLNLDPEEDLCDACALGKPTFSFAFIPQHRSDIKGKLWYFDVSGGGDLTPSLVDKDKYVYLFIDSCTRKYFPYFTKNKDEKTTMRILRLFDTQVLSLIKLPADSEIVFLQSDNGEMTTKGVQAFLRKRGDFITLYTPVSSEHERFCGARV